MLMTLLRVVKFLHFELGGVSSLGPSFGYFPNASKTWLVTKQQFSSIGREAFCDTAVKIMTEGRPHIGTSIGTSEYVEKFTENKIDCWI